jgi:hypothetical protein
MGCQGNFVDTDQYIQQFGLGSIQLRLFTIEQQQEIEKYKL